MTVQLTKATDDNREREAVAIDRITSPLTGDDFERDHHADALLSFWRRGTRDATFVSCARRGSWDDTMARLAFSGALDDTALPLMARQNIQMFAAVTAWRADLLDVAGEIVARTPDWQNHRGMELITRVILSGVPFGGWEAAMRNVQISTCLDFEN